MALRLIVRFQLENVLGSKSSARVRSVQVRKRRVSSHACHDVLFVRTRTASLQRISAIRLRRDVQIDVCRVTGRVFGDRTRRPTEHVGYDFVPHPRALGCLLCYVVTGRPKLALSFDALATVRRALKVPSVEPRLRLSKQCLCPRLTRNNEKISSHS